MTGEVTPYSLRRTFAPRLVALGRDMRVTMTQLGHTDPQLTLRAYAREMERAEADRERLRALVDGAAETALDAAAGHEAA